MPILDRSKIPQDKLDFYDAFLAGRQKYSLAYLALPENQGFDFAKIMGKVIPGNAEFFEKQALTDELKTLLTRDEMLFLAKMFRYSGVESTLEKLKTVPLPQEISIEEVSVDGIPAEWNRVKGLSDNKVILYLHGGGWVQGSAMDHRELTAAIALAANVNVLSIDYALSPDHVYPAHLNDCVKAYEWLLNNGVTSDNIIIAGDSAGGNLTLTTLLKLKDDGRPLPAAGVCIAPSTDVSLSDPAYFLNGPTDPILSDLGLFWWVAAYLNNEDPKNPYLSPIYGDLKGLPPLLIQASTSEMLYPESAKFAELAEKAGVDVTLQTWDDTFHVFQLFLLHDFPEAKEAINMIGDFVKEKMN